MKQDIFMCESQSHELLVLRITKVKFKLKGNFLNFIYVFYYLKLYIYIIDYEIN